jgi:hypothetical protein
MPVGNLEVSLDPRMAGDKIGDCGHDIDRRTGPARQSGVTRGSLHRWLSRYPIRA